MGDFRETNLWLSTLADRGTGDSLAEPREQLRTSYLRIRDRAGELATEIARDFPELTDHGINHLDSLWEIADLIVGPDFELNPAEAFVFGGAVLLHDLGLAAAAYPGGREELEAGAGWNDALALALGDELGHPPTEQEIAVAPERVKAAALKIVLRKSHADQAESLGLISWRASQSKTDVFLIDNSDLRGAFGRTIGRIARSHWWSVGDLSREFPANLAAPTFLPNTWTVDQTLVACLLRTADASHLDARRAPELLRAVRSISPDSEIHWTAQGKIHQPNVRGDRFEYTSGEPFNHEEAQAWWFCLDLLKSADRELREVDALLEDSDRQRFRVSGVRGVDDPHRMATYLRTEGWLPVNAVIHISDVNRIVEHLGGEQLYGHSTTVGVRELIQNGIDAIRARRKLEDLPEEWGKITVELGQDPEGQWIEVCDNGIGMSPTALTGVLLDFGDSLWRSPEVAHELPGLAGRGFQSIGRFGIGFFSVFMLGDRVSVASRRYDRGHDETHVLEFSAGIGERPLMRQADPTEQLREGGTRVRVWLRQTPKEKEGILSRWGDAPPMSLEELCLELAPASPVDLEVVEGGRSNLAICANDWQSLDPEALLRRLASHEVETDDALIRKLAGALRTITREDGTIVGRACVSPPYHPEGIGDGAVVVGGLRAVSLGAISGILVGEVLVAARNQAQPIIPPAALSSWATEQGKLEEPLEGTGIWRFEFADVIGRCGGDTGTRPIAASSAGFLDFRETVEWIEGRSEFFSVTWFDITGRAGDGGVDLNENVLAAEGGTMAIVSTPYPGRGEWPEELFPEVERYRRHGCDWKLVKACCKAWGCDAEEIGITRERGEYGTFRGGPMSSPSLLRLRRSDR